MAGNTSLALHFLLSTLFSLYVGVVLLRFLMQLARADFYNPLSQAVVKLTNPLLRPLRSIIPGWRGWDLAALLLAWLLCLANVALVYALWPTGHAPVLLPLLAVLRLIHVLLNLYTLTILLHALMSWFSPGYHPVMHVLGSVNAPIMTPLRRLIPPLGGLDLTPLFALLALQVLNILLPLPGIFR